MAQLQNVEDLYSQGWYPHCNEDWIIFCFFPYISSTNAILFVHIWVHWKWIWTKWVLSSYWYLSAAKPLCKWSVLGKCWTAHSDNIMKLSLLATRRLLRLESECRLATGNEMKSVESERSADTPGENWEGFRILLSGCLRGGRVGTPRTVTGMLVGESWAFLSFTDWWCEFVLMHSDHLVRPHGSYKGVWFSERSPLCFGKSVLWIWEFRFFYCRRYLQWLFCRNIPNRTFVVHVMFDLVCPCCFFPLIVLESESLNGWKQTIWYYCIFFSKGDNLPTPLHPL